MAGKRVDCIWAGCRAASLASRVQVLLAEIVQVRSHCTEAGLHEDATAATCLLGSLKEKLAWVSQDPYTLLQARDPDVAAGIIERRDALVASGGQPHRVIEHFVGQQEGSFREHMERYAAGEAASPELLRELLSYQLAKIDDTWAEAAHRDATAICKRTSAGKVPYIGAALRAKQTLASLDSMDDIQRETFYRMVERWKSIGQRKPSKASKLVPPRLGSLRSVASMVYRFNKAALQDWSSDIGEGRLKLMGARPARLRGVVLRLQLHSSELASARRPGPAWSAWSARSAWPAASHVLHGPEQEAAPQEGAAHCFVRP